MDETAFKFNKRGVKAVWLAEGNGSGELEGEYPNLNEAKIFRAGTSTMSTSGHGAEALRISAMLVALSLSACDGAPATVASSSAWTIAHSPGMPSQMPMKDGNYYFDFPNFNGVHYVYQKAPSVSVGQTVTMVFSIEGSGNFVATEGAVSARVRLFMQERGDRLTAAEQYKRWWSTAFAELKPGTFTLMVAVVPELWSSVLGKNGAAVPSEFKNAISNLANIGFTFGGTFAGHGVYVTGGSAARFILKEFALTSPQVRQP